MRRQESITKQQSFGKPQDQQQDKPTFNR